MSEIQSSPPSDLALQAAWSDAMTSIVSSMFAPPTEEQIAEIEAVKKKQLSKQLDELQRAQAQIAAGYLETQLIRHPQLVSPISGDLQAETLGDKKSVTGINQDTQAVADRFQTLVTDLLNQWNTQIQKQFEEDQRYRNSLEFKSVDAAINAASPDFAQRQRLLSALALGTALMFDRSENQRVDEVDKSAFHSVDAMQQMIPSDMRAELGLLGAMFMNLNLYQATLATVVEAGKSSPKDQLESLAKQYMHRLLSTIADGGFQELLKKVIILQLTKSEGKHLGEADLSKWVAILQLGMLLSALALFFKAQMGGMTGNEVGQWLQQILKGKTSPPQSAAPLVRAIQSQLKHLSPEERIKAIEMMMDYVDSNPSTREMTDPLKAASLMMATTNRNPDGIAG
ncbi:MAG: hypothetical protein KDK40_00220 [Chlamydiia bacterium]|nr:hypothetical protein [Chlamydiia bacterium]